LRRCSRSPLAARAEATGALELPWGGDALTVALRGDRLVGAGGPGRFGALEARLADGGKGYQAPTDASRELLGDGPAALVVDPGNLVKSARALPPGAYGTGPDGFVMRSLADRLVEPASHLRAVALRLEVREGAAVIDLAVEGEPPAPPEAPDRPEAGRP